MKFRDQEIKDIIIIEKNNQYDLINEIKMIGEVYNIIDLQYSTRTDWVQSQYNYPECVNPQFYSQTVYSVILLLGAKE